MFVKLPSNRKITLPQDILDAAGMPNAKQFRVRVEDGTIVLTPHRPDALKAIRRKTKVLGITEQDVTDAVYQHARKPGQARGGHEYRKNSLLRRLPHSALRRRTATQLGRRFHFGSSALIL